MYYWNTHLNKNAEILFDQLLQKKFGKIAIAIYHPGKRWTYHFENPDFQCHFHLDCQSKFPYLVSFALRVPENQHQKRCKDKLQVGAWQENERSDRTSWSSLAGKNEAPDICILSTIKFPNMVNLKVHGSCVYLIADWYQLHHVCCQQKEWGNNTLSGQVLCCPTVETQHRTSKIEEWLYHLYSNV